MKKKLCLVLALALLLALTGCGADPAGTTDPTRNAPTDPITAPPTQEATLTTDPAAETTLPLETADAVLEELRQNLPVMDGSTSLIPLEAGIRAALFGKSIEEATRDVSHTTSWDSFYNLINDRVDLVFSVPLSAQQEELAAQQGIVLEAVPVAMEGFVFVVNAENPVDVLTQQQIRDIYSGKITNWSQVGGLDEEIIPYQRNTDSGSQNYMLAFMGSTRLMDAPTELRPASMSGLMDVIAVNDNARAAIGYSVYAYAADMYGNGNEIKFIQVDGIAPSKETFADGSYPLMGYNYAIFNANEPEDSYVRLLVDWMLTPEGQLAIAKAGYVTVVDIGYNYLEQTVTRYSGFGTGEPAAAPASHEYVLRETVTVHYDNGFTSWDNEVTYSMLMPQIVTRSDGTQVWEIYQLTNAVLEQEINAWLAQQMDWVMAYQDDFLAYVDSLNQGYTYNHFVPEDQYYTSTPNLLNHAVCEITARNGILSAMVSLRYIESGMESTDRYYRTETASWDLFTGARLEVEDLFCRGVDIDEVLNAYLRTQSQTAASIYTAAPAMKADFASLPTDGWHMTHDSIYFDYGNPYFVHGEAFSLTGLPDGTLVTGQPRDFSAALDSDTAYAQQQYRTFDRDLYYAYNVDELLSCGFLKEDVHPNAAKINAQVMDHLNAYYTKDAIVGYFKDGGYDTSGLDLWMLDWSTVNLGNKYVVFTGSAIELYVEASNSFVSYPAESMLIFELETGKRISWQDMLAPGWENAVTWNENIAAPSGLEGDLQWVRVYNGECMFFCVREGGQYYYARIPMDQFNY